MKNIDDLCNSIANDAMFHRRKAPRKQSEREIALRRAAERLTPRVQNLYEEGFTRAEVEKRLRRVIEDLGYNPSDLDRMFVDHVAAKDGLSDPPYNPDQVNQPEVSFTHPLKRLPENLSHQRDPEAHFNGLGGYHGAKEKFGIWHAAMLHGFQDAFCCNKHTKAGVYFEREYFMLADTL